MSDGRIKVISKPELLGKADIMATEKTNIMTDGSVQVINKLEFIEVSDCDLHSHFSFINNFVDVDELDIWKDKNDITRTEPNTTDLDRFINQEYDEIIVANTEKEYVIFNSQASRTNTSDEDSFKLTP